MACIRNQRMAASLFFSALAAVSAAASSSSSASALSGRADLRTLSSRDRNDDDGAIRGTYLDGTETIYDDFALAWRFLGFYTDCDVCLREDDDGQEYFADAPAGCVANDDNNNNNNNGRDATVCRRYALWAAYVDSGYEGHGAGEYQHYDPKSRSWNDAGCSSRDDDRCVKMDCHDPYSKTFDLLGVFKDPQTDTFLESLIDYGGDCVWDDDEYKFMKAMNPDEDDNNAYWPPTKCTAYQSDDDDKVYYYDAVPAVGGTLGVGLFEDDACAVPVDNASKRHKDVAYAEEILGRARGVQTGYKSKRRERKAITSAVRDDVKAWNSAVDAFKVCQPCVSYDARLLFDDDEGTASASHNKDGDRYRQQRRRRRQLEEQNEEAGGEENNDDDDDDDSSFVCGDNLQRDEPINQCKVLVQNGRNTMKAATYRDILLAESQGVVTGIDMAPGTEKGHLVLGEPFVQPKHKTFSVAMLLLSMGWFGYALTHLFEKDRSKNGKNRRRRRGVSGNDRDQNLMVLEYEEDINDNRDRDNQSQASRKSQQSSKQSKKKSRSLLKKFSRSKDGDEKSQGDDSTQYSRM